MVTPDWVPGGPGSARLWLGWGEGQVSHNPLYSPSRANQRMTVKYLLKNSPCVIYLICYTSVYIHNKPYLCHVAIRLSCSCLAALLHGWRWWGRRREALSGDSRDLKQWYSRVEMHRDLRGHGVRCCWLQADWQRSSRALHGVVMVKDIQLRRNRVHHGHRGCTRDRLGSGLAFSGICGPRETKLRVSLEKCERQLNVAVDLKGLYIYVKQISNDITFVLCLFTVEVLGLDTALRFTFLVWP